MYIIGFIIIILDGFIVYLIPSYFNELNYFYPMLSITFLVSMYGYSKNYLKTSFILGFIYDLFYSNIFLYNSLIFLLLAKINKKIFNYIQNNLFNKILILLLNIILYDTINFFIVYFSKYNNVSFNDLVYKVSHSLLLNIIFIIIFNILLKKVLKRKFIK